MPAMFGRRSECQALDRLLETARAGSSAVLVVRGEAGFGKSALLDYLVERSSGCRVARACGTEAEMELPFAGLHQLFGPLPDRLERLPVPQRDALRAAFGLLASTPPDRFLVGLAALSLLSEVAEEQPLVCAVDDAQWLDRSSLQALAFVARRLMAEPIVLVFGEREPRRQTDLTGLPELEVGGLGEDAARRLLASAIQGRLDVQVRDRIVAETRGNPLALLELPRGMTAAELAGGFGLPDAVPLTSRIERSFHRTLETLPPDTRRLLLTAAAEPAGDVDLLWRAAERLGIGPGARTPAQDAGLIQLGAQVRFRHPLVRSAIYHEAPLAERRAVHRALAEATDPAADPDRRAWHRAYAADRPDEAVAGELERSAGRAQARGGLPAAAAFLERAAELTPDPARRGARMLAAAQAKFEGAATDTADILLAAAELCPLDALQRARLDRLRAQIAFARTRGGDAPLLLLEAARRLEPLDAPLARETYLEAFGAAMLAGRSGRGMREVAAAARAAPPAEPPERALDVLVDGLAIRFGEGYAAAVPTLRRALHAFGREEGGQWLWLACRVAPDVWDDALWHEVATRFVRFARDAGALTVLPIALTYRGGVHLHAGELGAAAELNDEAVAIAAAIGNAPLAYTSLLVAAWRGREDEAMALIEAGARDALARGEGRTLTTAEYGTAVLYNGLGRYEDALDAAERASAHDDLGLTGWALAELVEAGVRSGAPGPAERALERLAALTQAAGTDWALGVEARSRALLRTGPAAEALYGEAIERLARTRIAVHLARAHLLYGEWLRRESRRRDAREQLRLAHEQFGRFGAEAFAERARRELAATGEHARVRSVEALDDLTPQEAQIARLAGEGHSNPDIGAQLFISPRTVQYHLHKVFTKLEISSRTELAGALRTRA